MGLRRQLRVLIAGQQSKFDHVLATNITCWGYEAVVLPSASRRSSEEGPERVGDVLLFDVDEGSWSVGQSGGVALQGGGGSDWGMVRAAREPLVLVLSSRSVSRATLERLGAVAWLQKPFAMERLQRYLNVFQRLMVSQSLEIPRQVADGGLRVLIADDDKVVAQMVYQRLRQEPGFVVKVASDGLEAVEQCVAWQPHCVVTDLLMPWMNGYQMMRCLAYSGLQEMPAFVVVSALTQLEDPVERAYLAGKKVAYVNKPFSIDQLLIAIRQVCIS